MKGRPLEGVSANWPFKISLQQDSSLQRRCNAIVNQKCSMANLAHCLHSWTGSNFKRGALKISFGSHHHGNRVLLLRLGAHYSNNENRMMLTGPLNGRVELIKKARSSLTDV